MLCLVLFRFYLKYNPEKCAKFSKILSINSVCIKTHYARFWCICMSPSSSSSWSRMFAKKTAWHPNARSFCLISSPQITTFSTLFTLQPSSWERPVVCFEPKKVPTIFYIFKYQTYFNVSFKFFCLLIAEQTDSLTDFGCLILDGKMTCLF